MSLSTKKKIVWSICVSVGLIAIVFGSPMIRYKEVKTWICPISGSMRTRTTWFGGFIHEERTETALEKWLKHREPGFQPNWQPLSTTTYFIHGCSRACARAPEIYLVKPVLDDFVENSSEEKIAGFVAVLRHGSPDEQRRVVQSVADEALDKN